MVVMEAELSFREFNQGFLVSLSSFSDAGEGQVF